jgi:hypothetical protein
MQGLRRPLYAQRLHRDLSELHAQNFNGCTSSSIAINFDPVLSDKMAFFGNPECGAFLALDFA